MDTNIKNYQNVKIVKIILAVAIIAIILVWTVFCFNKLYIKRIVPDRYHQVINQTEGYMFTVDSVNFKSDHLSNTKDYIELSGWVISSSESMDRATIDIVLKNLTTGVCYKVPTTVGERPDITEAFGIALDKNFNWSGFNVKIPHGKKINLENNDYEIMALLRVNGGNTVLVDSGMSMWGIGNE